MSAIHDMATEALEQAWITEFELVKLREDLRELNDRWHRVLAGTR